MVVDCIVVLLDPFVIGLLIQQLEMNEGRCLNDLIEHTYPGAKFYEMVSKELDNINDGKPHCQLGNVVDIFVITVYGFELENM